MNVGGAVIVRDVTCRAPVNIAIVKYWGKRDETLHLPLNGSISVTLDSAHLSATTRVRLSRDFEQDEIYINGERAPVNRRVTTCLEEIRRRSRKRRSGSSKDDVDSRDDEGTLLDSSVRALVESKNNFPTAAGLASSAAGYACLVYALARAYGVEGEISDVAMRGSGSACRSIYGGFVEWDPGFDGVMSIAKQLHPFTHWPELRVCIVVVSGSRKSTPSSDGMKRSVQTSELLKHRANVLVPERLKSLRAAIASRDFPAFAEIAMKDSNGLHACCLDSLPPISYLNDTSFAIIDLVHALNAAADRPILCYTFDAGPNPCLFFLAPHARTILDLLLRALGLEESRHVRGYDVNDDEVSADPEDVLDIDGFLDLFDGTDRLDGKAEFLVLTKPGPGPEVVEERVA